MATTTTTTTPAVVPPVGLASLSDRWWALAIRGVAGVAFGILTLITPKMGLVMLMVLFGSYALVDGAFAIVAAVRNKRAGRHWGWMLFEGGLSIAAGLVAFVWPGLTALGLLLVIAAGPSPPASPRSSPPYGCASASRASGCSP